MPFQTEKKIVNLGRLNPIELFTQEDSTEKSDADKELKKWVLYEYLIRNRKNLAFPSHIGYRYIKTYKIPQPSIENKTVFKGTSHKIMLNGTEYQFELTHNIYYRYSEFLLKLEELIDNKKLNPIVLSGIHPLHCEEYFDRFEIISNEEPLGIGGFGAILKLAGTLAPKPQMKTFELKTHIERVSKIQEQEKNRFDRFLQKNNIKKESDIMSRFDYLRAKTPLPINGYYFSEMHQVTGENLSKFIKNMKWQQSSSNTFDAKSTFSDMISIMILMLKSLKTIHDKNYKHLDIKPLNFIIDNAHHTGNFIDFGFSRPIDDNSNCAGLTLKYASPEQTKSVARSAQGIIVTQKSDVYSLGESFKFIINSLKMETFIPQELTNIINDMCNSSDKLRPNVVDILEEFEKFNLKQKNLSNESEQLKVLKEAQKVRRKYDQQLIAKIQSTDPRQIFEAKNELQKIISSSLDSLESKFENNLELINLYIETLGIKAFANLKSKTEILNEIDNIVVYDFFPYMEKIIDINNIENKLVNNNKNGIFLYREIPIFFETLHIMHKKNNRDAGIDGIAYINDKFSAYFEKMDKQYTLSAGNSPTISHVVYLLATIKENTESPNYLLVQGIKKAIINYIREHYNEETVKNKTGAASNEQIKDMYDILKLTVDNISATPNEIISKIGERMNSSKQGLFTTNQSFFKYSETSDLKNKIHDTINQFQAQLKPINDEKFTEMRQASN